MMQIRSFGVLQTSKLIAVLYLMVFAIIGIPVGVVAIAVAAPRLLGGPELAAVILIPLVYGLMGFVFTAIACALYNVAAKWVGGIEIDIGPVAAEPEALAVAPDQQPQ